MNKKTIIISSVIIVSVGSIAFYFLYWRKKGGVSEDDKAILEQASAIQLSTQQLPAVPEYVQSDIRDEYGERTLKSSTIQGPVKF